MTDKKQSVKSFMQFTDNDSIFQPMQNALMERIRQRREHVEGSVRYISFSLCQV